MCVLVLGVLYTPLLQADERVEDGASYDLSFYSSADPSLEEALEEYQSGSLSQARSVFESFLETHPNFDGRYPLNLIIGDIAMRLGDPSGAEKALNRVSEFPPLASLALSRLGGLRLDRGDEEGALDALAAVHPDSPEHPKARYRRAGLLLKRGQLSEAIEDAEDAAMEATSDREREKARILLADIHLKRGSDNKALQILEELWWNRPRNETGILKRLDSLEASPSAQAILLRDLDAVSRYNVGKRSKDLRKRIRSFSKRSHRGLRLLGEGWLTIHIRKEREDAPELMKQALRYLKKDEFLMPWARLGEAIALRKVDRDLEAAESYLQLIEAFPEHHLVPRALQGAGELLIRNQLPIEGERALRDLIADFPQAPERPRALWELAWGCYLSGEYERSTSFLEQLMRAHPTEKAPSGGFWRERALYWKGRGLAQNGNVKDAERSYRKVIVGYPLGYYALLATHRLVELGSVPDESLKMEWVKTNENESGLLHSTPIIQRNGTLDTAVELVRAGLLEEARQDLQARLREGELHGEGLSLLVWIHTLQGKPRRAQHAMNRYSRVGAYPNASTEPLWKKAYPIEYQALVERFSKENGLNPYLVLGLIRQESHFNPKAKSHAYALGLMQLLARSARSIATKLLGYKRLAARDLYKPRINIELGTRMLRELHSMYRGNTALAVASYNAGPFAVKDWVHRFGHLATDEFVEMIPYRGTASYVKKVLGAACVFSALYGEDGKWGLPVPNRVPTDFGPFMKKETDS